MYLAPVFVYLLVLQVAKEIISRIKQTFKNMYTIIFVFKVSKYFLYGRMGVGKRVYCLNSIIWTFISN